ncbi:PadR family transcriptional regulator [bacterium]|nr:PadR family transcriptional regulator [bacterium]
MFQITTREEQILLAILALKEEAYLVAVKKYLADVLDIRWTVGAIHKPLRKLEEAGILSSQLGESTSQRGGRAKKIYTISTQGIEALAERKRQHDALWASFDHLELIK